MLFRYINRGTTTSIIIRAVSIIGFALMIMENLEKHEDITLSVQTVLLFIMNN
jgi:hypothetical protein